MDENYFDCSVSLHTIYHIDKDIQENAVRKLLYVTKPGQPVIIIYSNPLPIIKRSLNNSEMSVTKAMPLKDSTSDGGNRFSMSRAIFFRGNDTNEVDNKKWYGNGQDRQKQAINRRSNQRVDYAQSVFNTDGNATSFTTNNSMNTERQATRRTRSGGSRIF